MATLQSVCDRIRLDFLNRPEMEAEAVRAVQSAILHYERRRFPWNETVATLTTIAAQATLSVPADFLVLDELEIQASGGNLELQPLPFKAILRMNAASGANNLPTHFHQRGSAFYLSPPPDSAYLLNCYYLRQLTALTATSMLGSNDWLSACENVISFHATKLLWATTIRNDGEAAKYEVLERAALAELDTYNSQQTTGTLTPTRF